MAVTATILLVVAKVWQSLGAVRLLSLEFTLSAILWGLGLAGVIVAASAIVHRFWGAYRHSANYYLELVVKPLIWPDLIWLGLLPGLSEELLFRGVMLPALGLNVTAAILSSLVFGLLHLSGTHQWPYMIWATIVGGILAFSAIATGNLLVPIVAHVITNFVSGCLWKWSNSLEMPESQ
ncbi:MAG: CPBP family intramembrane metalloprotease [Cyanobacteria bacterium SBLK]|nr:CPBP family intramembrane metalloprotease [Cyanobacteria bacterium SBLK]